MRIVQVVTQLEAGGAQKLALLLAEGLRGRGHDVATWFLYEKRPCFAGASGLRVLWPRPAAARDYPRIALRLLAALRQARPDALITHTHYANVLGQAAAAALRIRKRLAVHHSPFDRYPRLARTTDRWFGSGGVYTVNIAVSRAVVASAGAHPRAYRRSLACVYNGVPPLTPADSRAGFRARHGIPADAFLVATVGRLAEVKNQGVLLEAVARLDDDIHLVVAGEGELRGALERQAAGSRLHGRVRFLGEVDPGQIGALYAAADVFAFPSRSEAMPIAAVEAMHAALPIVASDIPANREVLGSAALFFPRQDPRRLAEALRALRESPALAATLGQRAKETAATFSVEKMVDEYQRLLA